MEGLGNKKDPGTLIFLCLVTSPLKTIHIYLVAFMFQSKIQIDLLNLAKPFTFWQTLVKNNKY